MAEGGKVNCGPIDEVDAIRGMAHIVSYMLLHMAALGMDEEGDCSLLRTLIVDIQKQDEDVIPEPGKRYALGMIAAIEYTLREEAKKRKNGEWADDTNEEQN
jgi:hypothetical protein